ncbi:protein VAC14, partial [Sesamum angolense]
RVDRISCSNSGLTSEAAQHLDQIVPPVLNSFSDQDSRVRYYACEALYNIAKDIVTESDQFSIEEFIPLLRERMNVLNPYVRQFLVGWITVLDSVPDIDMLGFFLIFLMALTC